MKVNLQKLRSSLEILLKQIEEMRGEDVEIDDDLYWFVPKEDVNDPATEPTGLTLGSLEDDWEQIRALADGEKEGFGYMLVWASSVLRALGDRSM